MSSGKLGSMEIKRQNKSDDSRSRRVQILDAALALFAEHGIRQVTTRQIAQAVGISQPSLYAHFPTREAICAEVCSRAFTTLYETLAAVVECGDTPSARLMKLGRTYVDFGLSNEAAYRVAFMDELEKPSDHLHCDDMPHSHDDDRVMNAGLSAFSVLKSEFDAFYGAQSQESTLRAQSCWAALHGLVSLFIARAEFPWAERETLINFHLRQLGAVAFLAL